MHPSSKDIDKVHKNAKLIYSKTEIDAALDQMASKMNKSLSNANPIFLCVLLGGLVPIGNLLPRLNFQLELNYIHLSSYNNENKAGGLLWKAKPTIDLSNRVIIVFDDILDTGVTLKAVVDYCKQCEAKEVYTAVLLDKLKERKIKGVQQADFKALTIDDYFVYGYGLDYSDYLRNAPGIYAVV